MNLANVIRQESGGNLADPSTRYRMQRNLNAVLFLTVFALSQAVRDTFFTDIFQSVSFLFVAALAFGMSILLFGGWAILLAH